MFCPQEKFFSFLFSLLFCAISLVLNQAATLKFKLRLKALIDLLDFGQYCNNIVKLLVILSKISTS